MPSNEVKQRKKTQTQNDESSETNKREDKIEKVNAKDSDERKSSWVDLRTTICLLSLLVCLLLTRVVLQQNEKLTEVEEKYEVLSAKTASLFEIEEDVLKVSKKCESVTGLLESARGSQQGGLLLQFEGLQQDVSQLKAWASGVTDKRAELQASLAVLTSAVSQIEDRTSAITKDVNNKVASVRTDMRRMEGLASEVEDLVTRLGEMEDGAARAERDAVKRIGDLLADSIDRVATLRAASERNAAALEKLRRRLPELAAADKQLADRLQELENSRARVIRTVTFAGDLKPKVAAIKRDFVTLEPQMADLTLRIGRLAEDLLKREADIAELRETFANLEVVEGDLGTVSGQLSQVSEMLDLGDMLPRRNGTETLPQSQTSREEGLSQQGR